MFFCFVSDSGKYGFTDRVFDGMTVTINSVIIKFNSKVFNASLQVIVISLRFSSYGFIAKLCSLLLPLVLTRHNS